MKWDVCHKSQLDQNAWAMVEHERESNITHILPVTPRADVGLEFLARRKEVRCLMGGWADDRRRSPLTDDADVVVLHPRTAANY